MDHDAPTLLNLKALAVGVTILLLNVPPKLPTSPFLQNLRLNLCNQEDTQKRFVRGYLCEGLYIEEKRDELTSLLTKQYKMATSSPCEHGRA